MRTLDRNCEVFYYCNYNSKVAMRDTNNNRTGEYQIKYDAPKEGWGNVSSARGQTQIEQFGNDVSYDKVIVTSDTDIDINENSVLFIGMSPVFKTQTTDYPVYNYIVKRISRSLNSVSIAVEEVKVS